MCESIEQALFPQLFLTDFISKIYASFLILLAYLKYTNRNTFLLLNSFSTKTLKINEIVFS
jgi:hypothetical protein